MNGVKLTDKSKSVIPIAQLSEFLNKKAFPGGGRGTAIAVDEVFL